MGQSKRFLGIKIIGILNIVIGLCGAIPMLAFGLWMFLGGLISLPFTPLKNWGWGMFVILPGFLFTLGGIVLFVWFLSGIWILQLKPIGRKININWSPFLGAALFWILWLVIQDRVIFLRKKLGLKYNAILSDDSIPLVALLIAAVFVLSYIYYLTRPRVKELFK